LIFTAECRLFMVMTVDMCTLHDWDKKCKDVKLGTADVCDMKWVVFGSSW
jgi:hypothetical protein